MSRQPREWKVWAEKNLGLFWAGLPVASIGKQRSHGAIGWQIYELTSSPLQLGCTGVWRALPVAVSLTGGLLSVEVVAAVAVKLPAIKKFCTSR